MIDDEVVKPAKVVYTSAKISVRVNPIWKTYEIIDIPPSRVGAKLVSGYLIETTSNDDLEILKQIEDVNRQNRQQGLKGRPTKRDRRKLDGWQD